MDTAVTPTRSADDGPRKFFVAGVEVEFPVKPYKCQISTMNMVIRGLRHLSNTIIESPTGSGKTLSLLCSTLAWQRAEFARLKDIVEKEAAENALRQSEEAKRQQMQVDQDKTKRKQEAQREEQIVQRRRVTGEDRGIVYYDEDDDEDMDDFQPKKFVKKMEGTKLQSHNEESTTEAEGGADGSTPSDTVTVDTSWLSTQCGCVQTEEVPRAPKIFYCSRTHQQIKQVVRELRKSVYKDVKMTILSSREHTCIQIPWSGHKFKNKTEMCHTLLDPIEGYGCMYKNNHMSSHAALENCKMVSPWDVEDLVQAGHRVKSCPYFASRDLVDTADIVFCPYVYLIDPKIRNMMKLQLRGAVILLDEAHNIEDSCRDAASCSVLYDDIFQSMEDCKRVASMGILPEIHDSLAAFLSNLMTWMSQKIRFAEMYQTDKEKIDASTWGGAIAVASFEEHNVNLESILEFKKFTVEAVAATNSDENIMQTKASYEQHGVQKATVFVLEGLSLAFGLMYDNNMEHIWDYYVVVGRNPIVGSSFEKDVLPSGWSNASGSPRLIAEDVPHSDWGHYLNFLCMNPGVIFQPIADVVRSIVLTSGTLAPLETFTSELSTTFTNELQALHIIDENRLWVGSLGSGPRGRELQVSYQHTSLSDFRQELGNTILEVCKVIPYGVLCFLPSYGLLEALRQHWLMSGIWKELEVHKEVLCEMRGNKDFLPTIQAYYDSVRHCELGMGKGPLLFAIMRGKVSEGLDFADNRARGVITVGIPYPHLYDIQVGLKRKYNDANVKRGLKSGSQWYETQAYRC
ncbi:Fanconi anemia group J protein homolog isoform X2 [Zootermopsis nevadensis]|uniref:Fanconi anemia group J protein homolog isoform X2 n=1 Tax=Zootermopsis nevadensis TaxID=136037 RepID=UPI000B8E28F5|nr:Fanconi anemia group J protein homolog isoform X2 [Zootermopsis nevadensis]